MNASLGAALLWSPELVARIPTAGDAADAIRQAARPLVELGAVTGEFVPAVVAGEREHPSGVEAEVPFAVVGARAPGAIRPAAAVGVFKTPVPFGGREDPGRLLQARIVVVISLPEPGEPGAHQAALQGLDDTLRDGELAEVLLTVPATEAHALLCEAVDFYARQRSAGRPLPWDQGSSLTAGSEQRRGEGGARSVWRLIETGDNFLKYAAPADRARAAERARTRFQDALREARSLGDDELVRVVELRLADLDVGSEAGRVDKGGGP